MNSKMEIGDINEMVNYVNRVGEKVAKSRLCRKCWRSCLRKQKITKSAWQQKLGY